MGRLCWYCSNYWQLFLTSLVLGLSVHWAVCPNFASTEFIPVCQFCPDSGFFYPTLSVCPGIGLAIPLCQLKGMVHQTVTLYPHETGGFRAQHWICDMTAWRALYKLLLCMAIQDGGIIGRYCFKEILGWLFTIVLAILLIVQPSIDLSSMKLITCWQNPTFRPLKPRPSSGIMQDRQ